MEADIRSQKTALRRRIRALRDAMPRAEKEKADALLCQSVIQSEAFDECGVLLIYAPTGSEPDVMPIAREAWRRGKRVAFPISHTQTCTLTFHYVRSECELTVGEYGIAAPQESYPCYEGEENALCVVPGTVFDRQGYRIGYGKGYYDRFLMHFRGISMGLTYAPLLQERLVRDTYDLPVDILVTEKEVCAPHEKGKKKQEGSR